MDAAEIGVDTAGDAYLPQSGNGGYSTISIYDLTLRYRIARNRLDGTAELLLRGAPAARTVQRSTWSGSRASRRAASTVAQGGLPAERPASSGSRRRRPSRPAPRFSIVVEYGGAPKPRRTRCGARSAGRSSTTACSSRRSRSGAPTWFPCNDHPSDKASYRIRFDDGCRVHRRGQRRARRTTGSSAAQGDVDVYEQREPTSTLPRRRCRSAGTRSGRSRSTGAAVRRVLPAVRSSARCAPTSRRCRGCSRCSRSASGPTRSGGTRSSSPPTSSRSRSRRRGSRSSARTTSTATAASSGSSPTSSPTSGSATASGVARWQDIWLNEGFACYAEWLWSEHSGQATADQLAQAPPRAARAAARRIS